MRAVNILAVVLLLSVGYFNGAEGRSEDDLRLVGIRAVFTKVLVTNVTNTVFATCSRARGTAFVQPTPAVDGCTTCDQATGVAGSECDATAACAFAIVPSKPLPTACLCNTPGVAADPATAAAGATCDAVTCQNEPLVAPLCTCASDDAAPAGAGCTFDLVTANAPTPGQELACVRKPPTGCTGGCTAPAPGDLGTCDDGANTDACTWNIVIKAPAVICKCSAVNVGATVDTSTDANAVCPVGTLCTTPTDPGCPCVDTTNAPTGADCPAAGGAALACVGTPPTGCASCTTVATGAGLGTGTSCPAGTNCVRGTDATACTGKRKRRNVPVNLPQDSEFDNTELGSTIDSTIPKSGDVSERQKRLVFTLWETTTSILQNTVTTSNTATTVSLSYACQPSSTNDVVEAACTG